MDRSSVVLQLCILGLLAAWLHLPSAVASSERTKRTIGSSSDFVSCLVLGGGGEAGGSGAGQQQQQRYCSYDRATLEAIEKVGTKGTEAERQRIKCPPGRIFRKQCNLCECSRSGVLTCTLDLCAEDFFDAKGLPKYW